MIKIKCNEIPIRQLEASAEMKLNKMFYVKDKKKKGEKIVCAKYI